MPKFKIGDRVEVIQEDDHGDTDVGQQGKVVDSSSAPWVLFDTPTRYEPVPPFVPYSNGMEWKDGHMDCLSEDNLKLVEEA